MRCRESGISLLERDFVVKNCQGHLVPLGADERGIRIVFSLILNALAVGMILMLLIWIIGAGVIAE